MFSLHENTKIRLCRAAFAALCLVPTSAVLLWCISVHLPGYRTAHERAIEAQLGLRAQLQRASSPRPGVMLYESLELSDPDSGQPLARFPFVEVSTSGTTISVKLPYPAMVNGTRLDAFWKAAREQVRPARAWRRVNFEANNLTVHLSDGDQSFTDLAGHIENDDEQARFTLGFRRATSGSQGAEAAELSLVRHWQSKPTSDVFQLTTGSTPLSCALVASVWPGVERLGRAAEFQGRIFAPEEGGRRKIQLSGRLTNVNLDRLVSEQFPHKISGLAEVQLTLATIVDGRIEAAAGKITAGPGVISRSLVESARAHLHLQPDPHPVGNDDDPLPYRQLNVALAIGAQGLVLHGEVPHAPGAILVAEDRRVLLRDPAVLSQPAINVARMLVPQSDVQVPATRETADLTRALPLPSVAPPAGGRKSASQARSLRLGTKRE